jgi:hypothetical protein
MLLTFVLVFASCSKDDADGASSSSMRQMYDESTRLTQVQMDSISNFCDKLCGYLNKHPQSKQDEYFDPTFQNIQTAAALHGYDVKLKEATFTITVNDEWKGETFITY